MSKTVLRLLILAACATALAVIPLTSPAEAGTHSDHIRKHQKKVRNPGLGNPWPARQTWPIAASPARADDVCPGLGRSFDCRIWPPPIYDDPDRKVSGSDGG